MEWVGRVEPTDADSLGQITDELAGFQPVAYALAQFLEIEPDPIVRCQLAEHDLHRAHGVVVGRNDDVGQRRIAVGVEHADDRHVHARGLADRDVLTARVDDDELHAPLLGIAQPTGRVRLGHRHDLVRGDGIGADEHRHVGVGDVEETDGDGRSEEAMPMLGRLLAERHGFKCTVLFAINPADGTIDPDNTRNIPGLEALRSADLMIIATRFRDLPDEQMKYVAEYIDAGVANDDNVLGIPLPIKNPGAIQYLEENDTVSDAGGRRTVDPGARENEDPGDQRPDRSWTRRRAATGCTALPIMADLLRYGIHVRLDELVLVVHQFPPLLSM